MSHSFTSMVNNFLAANNKGSGCLPMYQTLPPTEPNMNGHGEQKTYGAPLPDNISLTSTSSAAVPSTMNPHVLKFSRIVDFFYANEHDNRETTKSAPLIEVGRLYPSPAPPSSGEESSGTRRETTTPKIQIIDWHMLDKWKFYPLSMLSSFTIRCCLYPFTVVKTCIQLQQRNSVYTSMFDAYRKIYASEGIAGLYKGFWVSTFQIVSGVGYVSTYEGVRHLLKTNSIIDNNNVRALIAGGCASMVGQTFLVPFDVISQHLMVLGKSTGASRGNQILVLNPLNISYENRSKFQVTRDITKEIYRRDGLRGFYRGYMASLGTYVPNSALWWSFYHIYQGELAKYVPPNTSHLLVQCFAAILGGFTTTILTNPLDVCRARLQVQRLDSFPKTFIILWGEERLAIFTKGLSARLTQSAVFSFAIILGYETIKRFSVKENYKDHVTW